MNKQTINNREVENITEQKVKEATESKATTTDVDTFLYVAKQSKAILPVNKSLYVYRLLIQPTQKAKIQYARAFEYLKQLVKVINNTEHSRLQKDNRYFYFQLVSNLSEKELQRFNSTIKSINSNIYDDSKKVSNITINLSNLLSYKTQIDKFYKVDIDEVINNK